MNQPNFCENGHQLEPGWPSCPFCKPTGFHSGGAPGGDKTRIENPAAKTRIERSAGAAPPAAAADPRKTVLLSATKKAPVVGWLVALDGPQRGEDFRLKEGQNIIGMAEGADIKLRGEGVSGQHASLRYRDGSYTLTDLDSTNGTFLNSDTKPIAREELKDNDVVRIAEISLKFKCL
jgi:Inner membrane component of T3SS, cytoplasmic domain